MEFAFVAAVGGVGFEDVAVAGFELAVDGAFLDGAGADVVTEDSEEKGIGGAEPAEDGDEFFQILS